MTAVLKKNRKGYGGNDLQKRKVTVWEIHPEGEKGKAAVGRICRK